METPREVKELQEAIGSAHKVDCGAYLAYHHLREQIAHGDVKTFKGLKAIIESEFKRYDSLLMNWPSKIQCQGVEYDL